MQSIEHEYYDDVMVREETLTYLDFLRLLANIRQHMTLSVIPQLLPLLQMKGISKERGYLIVTINNFIHVQNLFIHGLNFYVSYFWMKIGGKNTITRAICIKNLI